MMESAEKCPDPSGPEGGTSLEESSVDNEKVAEKDIQDGAKDAPSLDENYECSEVDSGDKEEQSDAQKSPQNVLHGSSPEPTAENITENVEKGSLADDASVPEVSDKDEDRSKDEHTAESDSEVGAPKCLVSDKANTAIQDPLSDHSPVPNKEDDASLNLEEKEDSNELEEGIRPVTNTRVNESDKVEDTNEISQEDLGTANEQPSPSSKETLTENIAGVEDSLKNQEKPLEEQESVVHSPNVEIPDKTGESASVVQEDTEASVDEPMDVDDDKGSEKPLSETEEVSHAIATADVDTESRDELMEVSRHEDENDPLSSADKEKDVEMSTNEDLNQEKNRGCEVEIHTDIVKDEQFNMEEDSGDSEKSSDSLVKHKDSSKVESGDGSKSGDSVDKDEDSGDGRKSEDVTGKDAKASEDGLKNTETSDKDQETSSDLTKEVPDKSPEEEGDKGEDTAKTVVQDTTVKEGDDDLCIVPDSVPESVSDNQKDGADRDVPATSPTNVQSTETTFDDIEEIGEVVGVKETRKERRKYRTSLEMTLAPSVDLTTPRPQRQAAKKAESQIKVLAAVESYELPPDPKPTLTILERVTEHNPCQQCGLVTFCKYQMRSKDSFLYFCRELCYNEYQSPNEAPVPIVSDTTSPPPSLTTAELERPFERTCGQCSAKINASDEKVLTWETMDFCSDDCLGKYQTALGSHCANCKGAVQNSSLGKYCVRFGYNIKQFCCAGCLEEFKKGLKVCSYCQKDISSDSGGFLAPVGDKGQFKDFCTPSCMEKYELMSSAITPPTPCHECAVCTKLEPVRVEVISGSQVHKLCSQPCYAAFKFVNGIVADKCDMCKKYFDKAKTEHFTIYYDDAPHSFCCKTCMNVYILAKRKIVPCSWCKVKKYNFDMIKKTNSNGQVITMCSLHCLNLFQVSASAVTARRIKCDSCGALVWAQYHLTMSDGSVRNFCTYNCVNNFQSKFSRSAIAAGGKDDVPVPTGGPKRALNRRTVNTETETVPKGVPLPVISSVTSLAPNGEPLPAASSVAGTLKPTTEGGKASGKQHIVIRPPLQPRRHNRGVQVQPLKHNKGVLVRPQSLTETKETQTDNDIAGRKPIIVPIPIPIYVPTPMCMYSIPTPLPVPFPLPIPVPIFIPTTRNSTKGILKEIKRIQEKIPVDPFEADLLMMAEMVAAEKKTDNAGGSESEGEPPSDEPAAADAGNGESQTFSPEAVDSSNTFGEDIMQMALKFASTLDEQPVDFDAAVAPSTITSGGQNEEDASDSDLDDPDSTEMKRASRKRPARSSNLSSAGNKRSRRLSSSESLPVPSDGSTTSSRADAERPDANMCLKFTYGVNAWRQWVLQKNAQLEKAATSNRKLKLFKTDLLQLTSDELNYSLCLFVKEVRKPNGTEYAPDTIYYLCLGIQLYLIVNGRVDNIFSDPLFEKFTECLDEMSKKFCSLYDDTQYIVTRVEEEHLWESKQLGAHSPQVLLSTLMFFNTKHFNITTVDEHMLLSFSHIMKHWKRNNNAPGSAGKAPGRNVLLRFYPSQAVLDSNSKKKKVYEQSENEDNPLRCPVKLYEFYLSKCPESVKTRNDVFYLQPERSCVPDSPVWYSTMSLGKDTLLKMLRRVKMVKEINMAILK